MAFQQGLSGLNMSAKALDAVGNNIANSQTVGFKSATTQFNDVYAAAIGTASSKNLVGQGGGIMAVAQNFTQGNVTSTNNPLDIAINGNGFYRFQPSLTDQTALYTRNGQLHLNSEGYIVNAQDQYLDAFSSSNGETVDQSRSGPIQISSAQLNPRATGYANTITPGEGGIEIGLNFDDGDTNWNIPGEPTSPLKDWVSSSVPTPDMYNYARPVTVYDQRGESHILTLYFVRQGVDGGTGSYVPDSKWQVHAILDGEYEITGLTNDGLAPTAPPTLDFSASGQLNTSGNGSRWTLDLSGAVSGPVTVLDGSGNTVDLTAPPLSLFPDAATEPNYALTIDFSDATQFDSDYDVNKLVQDGYGAGRISGVAVDANGMITARYSNGQTKLMGQIPLTTFQNPNGLAPLGNNMWAETFSSGQPLEGTAQSGSRGAFQSGSVEDANVDLTQELVNMITLQRAYQANAQTIKTQDQVLQTLVNLR